MFSKVLIANRGEIAVRIIRACEELGIATVAVYSELDRDAIHVKRADEAYLLGPGPAAESYLDDRQADRGDRALGRRGGPSRLRLPGRERGVRQGARGPRHGVHRAALVGDRGDGLEDARAGADAQGGRADRARHDRAGRTIDDARKIIDETIGYPVAVKAAGGGGGKGFRVALTEDKLEEAFEGAAREGEKFFSDATVYLERYLPDPRHVEVQVLADSHGNVIHLGERDCSLQRRHQKLIEEAPAPAVDDELRARIGKIATEAAAAVDYTGAGTIEGLLQDGEYFFLEMNTRVQVEHCVTEMVTGIDIVKEGIRVAAGEPLSISQQDVELRGHAIECRINAEDASKNFAPAPGTIGAYREPSGPGVRVDSGVGPGSEISPMYDPMVAKLIVWDADREQATARMLRALGEYEIGGLKTLIPFHQAILATAQWANAETCRDLIEDREWLKQLAFEPAPSSDAPDEDGGSVEQSYTVEVSGKRFDVKVIGPPAPAAGRRQRLRAASRRRAQAAAPRRARRAGGGGGGDTLASPIQGTVLKVAVEAGAAVEEGALIAVIEAMKMENEITAHKSGTIAELPIAVGASVASGDTIAVISAASE